MSLSGSSAANPIRAAARWRRRWRRHPLLSHRSFLFGATVLAGLAVVVAAGPALAPADPLAINPVNRLQAPNPAHWLGTDNLGRDLLSRLLYGARYSIAVGITAMVTGGVIGGLLGSLSGYSRGRAGIALGSVIDVFLAFPLELTALVLVSLTGSGLGNVILAISLAIWPGIARIVRGEVLRVRDVEFVEAARALGGRVARILRRHILGNVLAPLIVALTFNVGSAVLVEASLSFLGLGVPPPTPTWGNIANDSQKYLVVAPWGMLFSGAAVGLTVLSLNLVGDGLRDFFDPRLRQR